MKVMNRCELAGSITVTARSKSIPEPSRNVTTASLSDPVRLVNNFSTASDTSNPADAGLHPEFLKVSAGLPDNTNMASAETQSYRFPLCFEHPDSTVRTQTAISPAKIDFFITVFEKIECIFKRIAPDNPA